MKSFLKHAGRYAFAAIITIIILVFLNNTNLFTERQQGRPILLAHRGISQQYDMTGVTADTCTATRILPPANTFIENTIASMRASFEAGADAVEFDIHPTTDGEFAVFHDWTLDCRTDGTGVTREQTMRALKTLDIGFGYTADQGKTFPFRGKGIGQMPTLSEVLTAFPDQRFLVNIKSNAAGEGQQLADFLQRFPQSVRDNLFVYGGAKPVAAFKQKLPAVKTTTRVSAQACLTDYIKFGWSGFVPQACRNGIVYIPVNLAPWMWGWPDRLLQRFRDAGSEVFIIGPYRGGAFSTGVDTLQDLQTLPANWSGGLITNELERIAKAMGR